MPDDDGVGSLEEPSGGDTVINYYFPVQVEVVGSMPDTEIQRVANYVFGELGRELGTRV
jgi:hypothetical protein